MEESATGPGSAPKTTAMSAETLSKLKTQISAQLVANANNTSPVPASLMDFKSITAGLTSGMDTVGALLGLLREQQQLSSGGQPVPFSGLENKVMDAHRRLVPSRVPLGVNLGQLAQERERIIKESCEDRINDLVTEMSSMEVSSDSGDIAKMVELKMLKLREAQKKVREQVLRIAQQNMAVDLATERSGGAYRRPKKQTLRELRQLEKLERQQRLDRTRRERQTYFDYLGGVMNQVREFTINNRANQQRRSKLVRQIMNHHAQWEKEEQKRVERVAKDRLRALKADDEEAYLRLLDQQKDTRLTHLLKQTDEFLLDLSSKVVAQQNDARKLSGDGGVGGELDEETIQRDYYATAHRIQETVSCQSSLLCGGQLKEYQVRGLQWMLSLYNNHLNGILADEMGLGKTIQTISLITYLMEHKGQTGPFLVIVPLSTLTNWVLEFEKWAPGVLAVEYKGAPAQRKALQAQLKHSKFNVLLTTYEYIIKDRPFLSKIKWLYLIIDEGHRMKNSHSKLALTLAQYYQARFRLILTGTPLQNNLPELWALLNFILPHIFNSCKTFEEWFNAPFANTGEKVELNEEETLLIIRRLHKVLRPFLLRRLKKDVEAELPDKVEVLLKCPMSSLQLRLYNMIKTSSSGIAGAGLKRLNNTIMQLRKICNHPFVFEEVEKQVNPIGFNNDLLHRVAGKFDLLHRILPKFKAAGHRALIFFQMTQVMTIMEDFLNMIGIKYLRLDGSTKSEDRSELLARFNAPDSPYSVFLLSTRAGGLGLNLQSADTVIIFDSDWNPHQDLQAQDRAHRIGQTKEVRIIRLVTVDSVEEYILERAQFKLNLDGKVIQAGKFDQKSTNEEREAMLRAIFEGEQAGNDEEDVYGDDELNEIISRNEEERELYAKIDKELEAKAGGKPRLIEESELPSVYLVDVVSMPDSSGTPEPSGIRSARRKEISYDENMSDERWLASLEKGSRKRKSENEPIRPLKISVRSTTNVVGDGLEDAETRQRIVEQVLDTIENAVDESGHRYRADIFQELPPASQYPDYYQLIKEPISLAEIRAKPFGSVWELQADLDRMWANAQTYNIEGSQVFEDAAVLRQISRDRIEELMQSIGYGDDDDEASDIDEEPANDATDPIADDDEDFDGDF